MLLSRLIVFFAAALAPLSAMPAEQIKRIGLVFTTSQHATAFLEAAFWARMQQMGWVEGSNITAVTRYADGKLDRVPVLIAEVLAAKIDVLVTPGTQAVAAARKLTTATPIVNVMGDPVGTGLVESLARPGGNVTGVSIQNAEEVPSKWLELLREAVPRLSTIAVIVNPDNALSAKTLDRITRSERILGLKHVVLQVRHVEDYPIAIQSARRVAQAAIVAPDTLSMQSREAIAKLGEQHRLPILGWTSEFTQAGVLMAYGPDERVTWQRLAEYVDKILNGARAADLPIQQPTEFRLSLNLRTAQALGLHFSEALLMRADDQVK